MQITTCRRCTEDKAGVGVLCDDCHDHLDSGGRFTATLPNGQPADGDGSFWWLVWHEWRRILGRCAKTGEGIMLYLDADGSVTFSTVSSPLYCTYRSTVWPDGQYEYSGEQGGSHEEADFEVKHYWE